MQAPYPSSISASELMSVHLQLIGTDIAAWLELLSKSAIVEFPYAPSLGYPTRIEGIAAITELMNATSTKFDPFRFTDISIHPCEQKDEAWASFHGEAFVPETQKIYIQDYAAFMRVAGGKIVNYREYWNPCNFAEALNLPLKLASSGRVEK